MFLRKVSLASSLPKGFTTKIPTSDLRDAYNYAIRNLQDDFPNYDFEDFIPDNAPVDIPFKFKKIEIMAPEQLEDLSPYTKKPSGWLYSVPQTQWEKELKEEYSRDFGHILKLKQNNKLTPAIMLEHEFGDGRARNLLQYAIDEKTPVAIYKLEN